MNQGPLPIIAIPLRDGSEASVGYVDVRVGERKFALADIQDARQVAPDPETIALRVAGERQGVELQPARPGDGALLLEALFRLRPALRPAGFDAPTNLPPGFPPLPAPATAPPALANPWTGQSGWSPSAGVYSPPPGASAPMAPPNYGNYGGYSNYARPGVAGGRLSPMPRTGAELIGAAFELFVAHWRLWLLLGLAALLIPDVINGAIDAVIQMIRGQSLWAAPITAAGGTGSGAFGVSGASLPSGQALLLEVLDLVIGGAIGVVIGGWAAAVLGIASRNALFGRAPRIGADLRAGLRRALPAIGAHILSVLAPLVIMLPVIVIYGVMLTQFRDVLVNPNSLDPSSMAAQVFTILGCLALILLLPCSILAIFVGVRLILSAYIAATEPLGPVAAVRKSWEITHRQWWHTAIPIFVVELFIAIITLPAGFVQSASFGVGVLIVSPLFSALLAPLGALISVAVLYDLRLRREGYAALAGESSAEDASTEEVQGQAR